MKKIDIGQTLQILANAGVIAGIVFLAVELRQNNSLLAVQARSSLDLQRASLQSSIANNEGGLAELLYKARSGEELSGVEEFRLLMRHSQVIHAYESVWHDIASGPLTEDDIPIRSWAGSFAHNPGLEEYWNQSRPEIDPELVDFIEERILPYARQIRANAEEP